MNSKKISLALLTFTLTIGSLQASEMDVKYNSIKKVQVFEVTPDVLNQNKSVLIQSTEYPYDEDYSPYFPKGGRLNEEEGGKAGKVIANAKELVALGEDIYKLVVKGKPTNTITYVPISVIPKLAGEPVDIFQTENWHDPVKKTFSIVYTNYFNMNVVTFQYSVIYSYGGSYDGKGAYITAAQIKPDNVSTLFGFDFSATMKLGGIQNKGTRDNPIAGVLMLLEYNVTSVVKTMTSVDDFFITGTGAFTKN